MRDATETRSLSRIALGVFCWLCLGGIDVSAAQAPDTSSAAPSQSWKSCAGQLSAPGKTDTGLQAQFRSPQNVEQLLQNLKLAWENDWLLRPDFYDDQTLLKFFNGAAITWKHTKDERVPPEEVALETDSRVFPHLSVVLAAHCRSRTFPGPNGHRETIISMGGNFHINGLPIPGLSLTTIRQVLGPETRNELDPGFAGESEVAIPVTTKGSVVYTDPAKETREGRRIGLTFYFGIPPKPEPLQNRIGADDVAQWIVLSAARHRTTED